MSNVVTAPLSADEEALILSLLNIPISGTNQGIAKTSATTFENRTFGSGSGGVTSFNTRTGVVTLTSADVTTALGYTPGTGNGTVTFFSVISANGFTGTVATATTTPAITLTTSITGILFGNGTAISAATISTGLTLTTSTLTNNLSTGVAGGQSAIGGTAAGNTFTLTGSSAANTGNVTTPAFIFNGSTLNASSVDQVFASVAFTVNQTSSAGWTGLKWAVTDTASGSSATKYLFNFLGGAAGTTMRLALTNTGILQFGTTGVNGVQSSTANSQMYEATNLVTSGTGDMAIMARQGFGIGFGVSAANGTTDTIALSISNASKVGIGLGLTNATAFLHILGTTEQVRTAYDASNYFTTTVSSAGAVTLDAVGASAGFTFSDNLTVPTVTASGNVIVNGATSIIRLKGYTVAGLPAGTQGDTAFATDLLAPGFLVAAVGGGAVVGPVFYNGAAWVAY